MTRCDANRSCGRWVAVAAVVLACHTLVFAASTGKAVTVEGSAPGTDHNAMEQAKQDALRKAVEQACGAFISSQTQVENYQAVYDKAMSFAGGYITSYDVLDRRTENGISYCKVRAEVSTASFEQEWARLRHTIEAEQNPRCVVVIVEDNDADDRNPPKTNGVTQSILERFFIDKGVQLMDKGATEMARERDLSLAAINNDVNKLAAMAAAFKADVVIRGVAEARHAGSSEIGGRTMHRWNATLNVRAYHTDSARMLMSNTYSTSKMTLNANAGGDDALRACAEDNAAKVLRDIGEAWRKRQNIRRIVQVTIENCNRSDYKAFEEAMEAEAGVQDVKLRELVNNVCQVEVDWSYDVERLITRIEQLELPAMDVEVTEQTHDRATIKLIK